MNDDLAPGKNGVGDFEVDTSEWSIDRSIPAGDYQAVLLNIEETVSQAGNRMLVWDFTIVQGVFSGKEFRTHTLLDERYAWKLQELLRATGLGQIGQKLVFRYAEYVNRLVILHLEDDEFRGEKRSSIRRVMAPPQGPGTRWESGVPVFEGADEPSIGVPPTAKKGKKGKPEEDEPF